MRRIIGLVLLIFIINLGIFNAKDCSPRSFGYDSIVCVCNASYCDDVDPVPTLSKDKALIYTTSQGGSRFKMKSRSFKSNSSGTPEVTIGLDLKKVYQTVHGFGSTFSDSTGININSLPKAVQEHLMKSYFSKNGLQYTLCKVPIGGTEFSTRAYSYDDGNEDAQLRNFKLAIEDHLYKIPYIKMAKDLNPKLELFASASTAPIWMKHNGQFTGPDVLRSDMYQPWTNYFMRFLQSYKNESLEFWGITTGNHPSIGLLPTTVSSVGWPPLMMSNFIFENFGPSFKKSKFSRLKLITVADQINFFPGYIDRLFGFHNDIGKYIDGFGLQWYLNRLISHDKLTETHAKYANKFILGTQASEGSILPSFQPPVQLGDWGRAESYASDIIRGLENWVTGWVDGNIALDMHGGPSYNDMRTDATVIVNTYKQEFYKQPMFYALGHFSKFIPRNSTRVHVKQVPYYLDAVAFLKPNGEKVLVMLNRNNFDTSVKLKKSNTKEIFTEVPRKSIVTIVYL